MESISDEPHAWSLEGVVGGEGESQLKCSILKHRVGKTADHTVPGEDVSLSWSSRQTSQGRSLENGELTQKSLLSGNITFCSVSE